MVLSGVVLGYTSFAGTLPNISSITTDVSASGPGWLVTLSAGPQCLYNFQGLRFILNRNIVTGAVTTMTVSTPGTLAVTSLTGTSCPPGMKISGNLNLAAPQPMVRLI